MNSQRFTRDGSDALEERIDSTCRDIATEITQRIPSDRLQGLVLAGGYGRGEGGVLETPEGHAPYNDLEFFLLLRGMPRLNERRHGAEIHDLAHRMTERLGIEVEFKITSLEALAGGITTMFIYDLVEGHRIFAGPENLLEVCRPHAKASRIPPHEATRLLMNRCSGLLYAKERLSRDAFNREDADFVARNIAKARLALGDALLAVHGLYHWSCIERHQVLRQLEWPELPLEELITAHADGVDFKLHPTTSTATHDELAARHQSTLELAWPVWRHVEECRLHRPFPSPATYSRSGDKCPETQALKNLLLRLRTFGRRGLHSRPFRYPRAALLNTLPILLWDAEAADPAWLSSQLVAPVTGWRDAIPAYQRLWEHYN